MPRLSAPSYRVAVIGGGPAGLMAAEVLAEAGIQVDVYDAMPSVARKFLLAGIGGMNITHSEAKPRFLQRYGDRQAQVAPWLQAFDANALRQWIHRLGIETFIGSSGRVFPTGMKAAPLLRAWLKRLRQQGVQLHARHRWLGWNEKGELRLQTPDGEVHTRADACLLALGGASWPRLGSDAAWLPILQDKGVTITPLQPANCGFDVAGWSDFLCERHAGAPVKNISLALADGPSRQGEFIITRSGVEGSLIYAFSAAIREQIVQKGKAQLYLDLLPQTPPDKLQRALDKPRGSMSLGKFLHRQIGLSGVKAALLHELASPDDFSSGQRLAAIIKALPLPLEKPRPLAEAISTAGGIAFTAMDARLMLKSLPGVFCAGEMLDWEAPTGGYLLTACFASGRFAANGLIDWLKRSTTTK